MPNATRKEKEKRMKSYLTLVRFSPHKNHYQFCDILAAYIADIPQELPSFSPKFVTF